MYDEFPGLISLSLEGKSSTLSLDTNPCSAVYCGWRPSAISHQFQAISEYSQRVNASCREYRVIQIGFNRQWMGFDLQFYIDNM